MENLLEENAKERPLAQDGRREARLPQVILLLAGSCMPIMGSMLFAPVLPQMSAAFAGTPGSAVLVPMVLTMPALMMALLAPFAGAVVDRMGRRKLLLVAMVVYAVFGAAPALLDSLGVIVATRIVVGIAEAAIMTCCTTLLTDYYVGVRRAKYLGLQAMVGTLAATVFLVLGGALGNNGWQTPFWVYAIGLLLVLPMAKLLWEPERNDSTSSRVPVPWRAVGIPAIVSLFGGIVFYTLVVHLPYVLSGLGVTDAAQIGLVSSLAALATAVGSISFRWLARFGTGRILPAAFAVSAAGLITVWLSNSVTSAMAGALVAGLGTGVLLPTLLTWAVASLSFGERGRGTGIWTAAFWSGQFLTPLVIAAVAGPLGGLHAGIGAIGMAAMAAAVVSAVLFARRRSQVSSEPERA